MADSLSRLSRLGRTRVVLLFLAACGLAGLIFLLYQHRTSSSPTDRADSSRYQYPRPRHEMHGFSFHGIHEGKRTISIKADRFAVEKKKLGYFRFGLMNVARLTNAVIDIYGKTAGQTADQSGSGTQKPKGMTFEHIFSKKALPSFPVKRVSSIVAEPVHVKLHDEESVVTEISASSASIRMKKREVLFEGKVRVVSGNRVLTTDQLSFLPENAVLRADGHFVLRTPEKQFEGKRLTTDIFLTSLNQ